MSRGNITEMTRDISAKDELEVREVNFTTIPFGPQHPASGHFHSLVRCYGEQVVELTPYPGYLHRGFERLMEYRDHAQNTMLCDRICILDPFANEMGYVNVVEMAAGVEVPERAKFIRTIMAELGRVLSHITWIGVLSMVLGLDSGTRIAWGDREKVIRLNEIATGGRIYPCYFIPGGVRKDFPEGFKEEILKVVDYIENQMKFYDNLVFYNPTFVMRLENVGILRVEDAVALGITGPNLRASGVSTDVRKDEPYDAYAYTDFKLVSLEKGDAYTRALCRRGEIIESISIIRQALDKMPEGDFRVKWGLKKKVPSGEAYFCCEAARGELCFHMVSDGTDKPYRVKVRGPSFSHTLAAFPHLVRGAYIADIPAIYWSLDPCPADMDR
jgi:NADH-quinone oxidoreductase subunit D